jgi:hypothetical protein
MRSAGRGTFRAAQWEWRRVYLALLFSWLRPPPSPGRAQRVAGTGFEPAASRCERSMKQLVRSRRDQRSRS